MNKLKLGDVLLVNTSRKKNERFQITGFQELWLDNKTNYRAKTESLDYPGYFKLFPVNIDDIDNEQEIL